MKKYILVIFSLLLLNPCLSDAQTNRYVRKNIEPDFFIPSSDKFNRPEKLPPIYKDGEKVTGIEQKNKDKIPEYQKKYEQYYKDLENVAKTGEVAQNQDLDKALQQMNNGEVFEVKETPLQNTEVKDRFEKALEQTLNEN